MHTRILITFCALILFIGLWILPAQIPAQDIPEEALILKEQGDRAIMRNEMEQAVRYYEKALSIYPDLPEVIYFLGLTYDLDFEDFVNAIYYYRRYLEIEPQGEHSSEILDLLQKAEERQEARKRELGLIEKPSPITKPPEKQVVMEPIPQKGETPSIAPAPMSEPSTPRPKPLKVDSEKGLLTYQMEERLLKYDIKLRIWEREGFVERFNELARTRISPLEQDIASQREALRMERKKVTDFINYPEEAINLLLEKAVFKGIETLGVNLSHYPEGLSPEYYIRSYDILDLREDARFVNIIAEVNLDLKALSQDLFARGFIFEPNRVTIILQNVQGDLADNIIEQTIRHSNFVGPSSGGLYPIYTSLNTFAQEIQTLKIGKYRLNPVSIGKNSITIQVLETDQHI